MKKIQKNKSARVLPIANWQKILDERCPKLKANEKKAIKEHMKQVGKIDNELLTNLFLMSQKGENKKYLEFCKQQNPVVYEEEYKALRKIVGDSLLYRFGPWVALYLVFNFYRILSDKINLRLNPKEPEKLSPFVYSMQ